MSQQVNQHFTGLPPLATACGLCGDIIHSFTYTQVSEIVYHKSPDVFSKENPWIYGRSTDLDDIHFDELWVWSSVFRAIMCRMEQGTLTLHLSGVGELKEVQLISLPDDEQIMALFNHRDFDQLRPPRPTLFTTWENPKAFTMHERCWQLMTRILDVRLIKQNMEIFVRAMCDPWLGPHLRPFCHLGHPSQKARQWREFIYRLPKEYHRNVRSFYTLGVGYPRRLNRHFSGADPLNDPFVQGVMLIKQVDRVIEDTSQRSISTHPMSRRSQSSFNLSHIFLPAELVLIIADFLEHREHIRAMISIFPTWYSMIPDSYWRRRFINDNCLKDGDFPAADALDWQHVYLDSDRLLSSSLGWRNRQRILKQLRKAKERFMQALEEQSIEN
ncbi:hypothetical protein N7457_008765 [Penicillium paradoxum]|uniref:uncharacterized protein n=1 Tax=Penicillium paradoxum TaxID=176176 RepID=UPI00254696F6|nr:uncharacterized protein N7457_008765 [Penicillium paradoxum]KAJ5773869.1 hypothetical protein N7457_008765 [Penicillium paradoxum]